MSKVQKWDVGHSKVIFKELSRDLQVAIRMLVALGGTWDTGPETKSARLCCFGRGVPSATPA